jgi:hypothetical protein
MDDWKEGMTERRGRREGKCVGKVKEREGKRL